MCKYVCAYTHNLSKIFNAHFVRKKFWKLLKKKNK